MHDINNKGWIVGVGLYCTEYDEFDACVPGEQETHAFLLVPIDESTQCAGDADGNGVVDVFDLLAALDNWSMECVVGVGPPLCIGDVNADGIVDVFDLLDILDNWGQCESGSPPASLESLLVAAGLPSDADDDYLDILTNGTQAEKDNYNCWVEHYLSGCGALCQYQCPDDDPWGHH